MERDCEIVVRKQDEVRVWDTAEGDVCISRDPHDWETVDGEVIIRIPREFVQGLVTAMQVLMDERARKDGNV